MLNPDYENLRWIAGPLACGIASFVMAMTNTVHPPGGATALLAAVDPTVEAMGWMFIPFILLGCSLMFVVAILVNNIQRQFPVFWWTPNEVGTWWNGRKPNQCDDVESMVSEKAEEKAIEISGFKQTILLTPDRIMLPEGFVLGSEEAQILQEFRDRLREWKPQVDGQAIPPGQRSFSCDSEKTDVEPLSGD